MAENKNQENKHKRISKMPIDEETLRNDDENIPSDTLGSYTGVPLGGEKPVQDADDL